MGFELFLNIYNMNPMLTNLRESAFTRNSYTNRAVLTMLIYMAEVYFSRIFFLNISRLSFLENKFNFKLETYVILLNDINA